jgi:deoxyribodipyrimidine photolyase-related protein
MTNTFLLFPIHLFKNIDHLKTKDKVYLIEDARFFTDLKYHKLKIAFHRATMRFYYDYLQQHNINTEYIEFNQNHEQLYKSLHKLNVESYNLGDNILKDRLVSLIPKLKIIDSLNFLVSENIIKDNLTEFFNGNKYNHKNFYKWQRTRLNILIESNGEPTGGKWSFDEDNRNKIKNIDKIPPIQPINNNNYVKEAIIYTQNNFKDNYGDLNYFIYPVTYDEIDIWINDFLQNKFNDYGEFQDAVIDDNPFLYHSVLSPVMNIGLITDREVLDKTEPYFKKAPINSVEGFIRQIIGWRNYIYMIYLCEGDQLKKANFLNHTNRLNKKIMWEGNTQIDPIDDIIKKITKYGYANHIERLMFLGNYLLLMMIKPLDVYEIFMEWTIDAYEWVMVPNVFCMSQFADGGLIMTRPYFSSSNYIIKMSNYRKGEWSKIFDDIYYNFINNHIEYLQKNYSTSRQVSHWKKKTVSNQQQIIKNANDYIQNITFSK